MQHTVELFTPLRIAAEFSERCLQSDIEGRNVVEQRTNGLDLSVDHTHGSEQNKRHNYGESLHTWMVGAPSCTVKPWHRAQEEVAEWRRGWLPRHKNPSSSGSAIVRRTCRRSIPRKWIRYSDGSGRRNARLPV